MSRKTRKLIWSAPLVAVLAVVGVLAMFAAQPTGSAQADHIGLPGAPTNVTAEAAETDGHETIILSWDAPDDDGGSAITGYRIDYLDNASGRIWQQLTAMTTATEYSDTHELEAESSRAYRVFAMNALGTGPTSEVAYGETGMAPDAEANAPGQVTGFGTPARDGPTKLRLSWNAPAKPGSSPITSYRIHFADAEGDIPDSDGSEMVTEADDVADLDFTTVTPGVIDTGSAATTYTLMGLRARQTWHFVIYARNDTENSEMGSHGRNQTTTDPINPAAPTGLRAVSTATDPAVESNDIDLYWYWPTDDGGAPIADFRVEVRKSGKDWPAAGTLSETEEALNTALSAAAGNGAIDVALPDGSNAYDWQHDADAGTDAVTGTLQYRVFAQTATGPDRRSSASNMATETVNAGNSFAAPGAPTRVTDASIEGQLSLEWEPPAGDTDTGYRLDIAEGNTDTPPQWRQLEINTIFSDLPYVHENLAAGGYRYRVSAKPDSRGLASISARLEVIAPAPDPVTAPGAPQNLTVDVVNSGQIDLSWEKPAEDGGSEITGYRVHITNDTTNADLSNTDEITDADGDTDGVQPPTDFEEALIAPAVFDAKKELTFSVTGLRAQQTWTVAVTAHNEATPGNSLLSDSAIVTMPMFDVPAMPVGLVAESAVDTNLRGVTKQGVLLMWNAPETPAGAQITAYEVQSSVNGGDYKALVTLTGTADNAAAIPPEKDFSTFTTDDEEPAEDEVRVYRVRTVAQAVGGEDQEQLKSEWAEVRFPADTSHTEPPTVAAPTGFTVVKGSEGNTVLLEWTAGADATNHWVAGARVNDDDTLDLDNSFWQVPDSNSRAVLDMSDKAAGNYQFQVIAGLHDSAAGTTMWSAWMLTSEDYEHNP